MILFVYMILKMILSFVIDSLFYASFCICIKTKFKSDNSIEIYSSSNLIENIYSIFLFVVIIYSITKSMYWTEAYIQLFTSIVMGLFTLIIILCSYFYAMQSQNVLLSVSFFSINTLSYFPPLIMNVSRLKVCDYLKGILYNIYLIPTYINLFTNYAISNIHDVACGSRPSVRNSKMNDLEKIKETKYKNYRSRFLIIWAIANISVGFTIASRNQIEQSPIILEIGSIFLAILLIKLVLASLYWLKSKNDRRRAYKKLKLKSSNIFTEDNIRALDENLFEAFENPRESAVIIRNSYDNEANKVCRSSVANEDTLVGFDLKKEHNKQNEAFKRILRHSNFANIQKRKFRKLKCVKELYSEEEDEEMNEKEEAEDKKEKKEKYENKKYIKDSNLSIKDSDSKSNFDIQNCNFEEFKKEWQVKEWEDMNASITIRHRKAQQISTNSELIESDDIQNEIKTPESEQNYYDSSFKCKKKMNREYYQVLNYFD